MKRFLHLLTFLSLIHLTAGAQQTMTPELLWQLGRVSGGAAGPDGSTVLYGVTRYDLAANKGNRDLYLIPAAGGEAVALTATPYSEYNEQWHPGGEWIGFLSAAAGSPQWYEIRPDGSGLRQVTDIAGGIANFAYSPDGRYVSFTRQVKTGQTVQDRYPDLPLADARIIDDLMYRHWDSWDDYQSSHLCIATYSDGRIGDPTDIMEGQPFDAPLSPFGGTEQINWHPQSRYIAYTIKQTTGKAYAESTDSHVLLYDLETGTIQNLSEGMPGYDRDPVFSHAGRYLLWTSMERAGFESDRTRCFLYDFTTGERFEAVTPFDDECNHPVWSTDDATLYFLTGTNATYQVAAWHLASRSLRYVTEGSHNYTHVVVIDDNTLLAARMDMNHAAELFTITLDDQVVHPLTHTNDALYAGIQQSRVEKLYVETTDGQQMLSWVIYPPDFDPNKKYPALLYCQGGPQSAVSQFYSYRWNFQLMAANGYIVIAPNRRGLPSFGQAWNDQISGDWGGQNMQDYLSAIDALAEMPYVDRTRLGAVGASYGGYSVYWLAGNHNKRFKALVAHCGLFNLESWYGTTEELFFANWDVGGPYWQESLQDDYLKFSPHRFVQQWDTPILVIHGEKDFRVPVGEGMQAFQAAQVRGIPSRFLYFPEEGHWVQGPQNGVLWHREFFRWLDQWLK